MMLKFETNSTASEFTDLENLIGSLHTSAPNYGHLIVHDMGLTNGQSKLLKRYKNVRVVSSRYLKFNNTLQIAVDQEFIFVNNTLHNQHNQRKHKYLDSIRKRFYLAIVIPFIDSQLNRTIIQLKMNEFYPPCRNRSNSVDLIFYYNRENFSSSEKNISQLNHLNQCYNEIHYIAANLSNSENFYPIGSANMWKKLFINEQSSSISLRARGYTHFFLLEPDTRPIRSYWLDAIIEKITNGHDRESCLPSNWWIIGSIYRGTEPIENHFLHINGNALYHLSPNLIDFIENVSNEYPYHSNKSLGFDLDLFLYLFKHIDIAKTIWHKFQFTDLIQNCWYTSCNDSNAEFLINNPNTYLIHGYKIERKKVINQTKQEYLPNKSNQEYSSYGLYCIVLLGLFLFICGRFRYYSLIFCYRLNARKRRTLFG